MTREYTEAKREYNNRWDRENKSRRAELNREWRQANPEKYNASKTKWRKNNPVKTMLITAKTRAKRKGIEFSLTDIDVSLPEVCPILGITLQSNYGTGGWKHDSYSLDRIDNSLGYIKGNVRVVSNLANQMKSYADKEQLLAFAKWVLKEYGDGHSK